MKVSEYIFDQVKQGNLDSGTGKELLEEVIPDDIAIVGMSCEYTNVKDIFEFYNTIKNGMRGFKEFPEGRVQYIAKDHEYLYKGATHIKSTPEHFLELLCKEKGAYLEDIDTFDYEFFGIPKEEAKYIDPTHRLIMKHSYLALEDAGIKLDAVKDTKAAIYIGKDKSITASYRNEIEEDSGLINSGCWEGILASRLNYIYNLSGGSFVVDTACSSSLVAAHLAVKTLRDKEIDTAIVGGIALGLFPRQGSVIDQYSNVETPRSFLKVFDAESQGTIFGEGAGIVVLKRLSDALADNDNIYSIIRGSMINSDGKSNGLTAPNPHAQKDLLLEAYDRSHISPESVEYIDAHGTGTKLGDPIEVRGLTDAYRKYVDKRGFCALTSLKENIGHTVGAAGVGGLIKMSLALRNKEIFPNQSFEAPNEYIKFVDSPFYIPTKVRAWEKGKYPRRGGISSFGFSGTNAHVILEEYDNRPDTEAIDQDYPFVFSAQSSDQLVQILKKFAAHESYIQQYSLKDISYTLVHKRNHFKVGVGFKAETFEEFMSNVKQAITAVENGVNTDTIFVSETKTMTSDMKKLMQHQLKTSSDQFSLDKLIKLYLDGYDMALESFTYGAPSTVSLPTYEFRKDILWGTVKKHNNYPNSGPSAPIKQRLLKQQTLRTEQSDVYSFTLSTDDWFVDDHRIGGKRTFSGTTYTELAAEIATIYFNSPSYTIEKLYFKNLIQLDDKSRNLLVHVNKTTSKVLEVEVFSYEDDQLENYVTHAVFTMRASDLLEVEQVIDVKKEFEPYLEPTIFQSEKNNFFKGRWDFGSNDFRMTQITKTEVLLSLALKDEYLHDLNEFYLHPSILDGILGAMVFERAQARAKHYLPLSYSKFTYTGQRFTKTMYSKTVFLFNPDEDHDVITAQVMVYNGEGNLVAYLDKYIMKAVANIYFKPYLHQVQWEKSNLRVNQESISSLYGKKILVVGNEYVSNCLAIQEPIEVDYVDYKQFKDMQVAEKYDQVIYAPWISKSTPDTNEIESEMVHYFNFAKTVNKWIKKNGKVLIVGDRAFTLDADQGQINPLQYSLLSSGRILGLENTGFRTQMIQMDSFQLSNLLSLSLMDELDGKKVIYHNQALYEEVLVELKDLEHRQVVLEDQDCVVVTGGYGGIGLEYVEELLALQPTLHIAILGRTDMYTQLSNKENRTAIEEQKWNKINKLMQQGDIQFYPCDISCEADVKNVIMELARNKTIAGVVHLAGVPEEGMLFSKSEEQFMQVVSPKVTGTVLLLKYLKEVNANLQFFVTSSSMTTIVGSAGQFSYTFANAFLEGCAMTEDRFTAVLWPGWNETGMALNFGDMAAADEHLLMKSISSIVGREYIKLSIGRCARKVIVGEFNTAKVSDYLGDYMILPPNFMNNRAIAEIAATAEETNQMQVKTYEQLTVTGTEQQDDVEKFITVIFASVLDREEIDVHKSFTELGGDSLKAFAIYAPIADQLEIDIEVADVFIYPTITQLSEYVRGLVEEKNE